MIGRSILRSGMVQQQNAPGALPYAADVLRYGSGPPPKGGTVENIAYGTKTMNLFIRGTPTTPAEDTARMGREHLAAMNMTCVKWAAMSDDEHFNRVSRTPTNPLGTPMDQITPTMARDIRSIITAINAECLRQGFQAQGEIGRSAQNIYDYGTRAQK